MQSSLFRNPALYVLALLYAAITLSLPGVLGGLEEVSTIAVQERASVGGTDWVRWEDSPEGVIAKEIHPVIKQNENLKGQWFREGDRLLSIDYHPVFRAEMAENLLRASEPGRVFIYQIDRENPLGIGREERNIFVVANPRMYFMFRDNATLWSVFPYLTALGLFLALISLLIIYPILRPKLSRQWPVIAVLLTSTALFVLLIMRHFNLVVRSELLSPDPDRIFTALLVLLLVFNGIWMLMIRFEGRARFYLLPVILTAGLWAYHASGLLFGGETYLYESYLVPVTWTFSIGLIFAALLLSVTQLWRRRSGMDRTFHALAILYTLPLLILNYREIGSANSTDEWLLLFNFGTLFIPMVNSAASQLKFGRVSVVLTGTLQYVLFTVAAFLLFFIIGQILQSLEVGGAYRQYFTLLILILVLAAAWSLYRGNRDRLRRYFITSQQKRRQEIERFVRTIPQYTSSQRLTQDSESHLRDYLGTAEVHLWLNDGEHELPEGLSEGVAQSLFEGLEGTPFWADNTLLGGAELPEASAEALRKVRAALAAPVPVNEHIHGLLILGRKPRGVYNLEDLEIIFRMLQQVRLTLGVLHLMEREKLLLEKNYEANLTALRSQINPHFLFNTLNTISALIHDAPDDAEEAVEKLAFIFRYTLKNSSRSFVTLEEELSLIRTYLEIEEIRFGDRLQVSYDIDKEMLQVELPALVLQTIIENCVKHGISKILEQGKVSIKASKVDDHMEIAIYDNGPGIDLTRIRASTGLNNIITRLDQIYQVKNLLYFKNTGDGTLVTVKIPLQHESIQSPDRG